MPTWLTSSRNQLRSPSGAQNEAPDGPGAFQALRDDVENFLGIGGAEYCANAAALAANPSSRRFVGKLAYRADQDTIYRYVGAGNTALAAGNTTALWQAWEKPATAFTPSWGGVALGTGNSAAALWGISAGMTWVSIWVLTGTGYNLTAGTDLTLAMPSPIVGQVSSGSGYYQPVGASGTAQMTPLTVYSATATPGQATTALRIRAHQAASGTSPQGIKLTFLATVIPTQQAGDGWQINMQAPSALVA